MDDLERLVATEQIKVLKARYFRYVDLKSWVDLTTLFATGATIQAAEFSDALVPFDEAIASLPDLLGSSVSVHQGYMPEIEILDVTHARGIWAMSDRLYFPPDATGHLDANIVCGAGHYHETYVRQEGRWRIETMRITRLRLETVSQACLIA